MITTLWDYIVVFFIYAVLFGSLFVILYFLGWAFVGLIGAIVRFSASIIRGLRGPAERELESVRLKKDLANINVCVLKAQEDILTRVCRASAKRQR